MRTITTYKVVYVDEYGDIQEFDFETEDNARTFSNTVSDSIIYKVSVLGSIERIYYGK